MLYIILRRIQLPFLGLITCTVVECGYTLLSTKV